MRAQTAGIEMANAIISFVHLMYQKGTANRVLSALIKQLEKRKGEFV